MADNGLIVRDYAGNNVTLASKDIGAGVQAMRHQITDGTNFMPTMDAAARPGFVTVTDATNTMPTMDVAARKGFVQVTNGTQSLPTGDAAARKIFVTLTDGTGTATFDNSNTTPKVSLYGKGTGAGDTAMPSMDTVAHRGYVQVTNGTQSLPTGDAAARTIYVTPNDGTNAITVKAASTQLALTDTSLVVAPLQTTDGTHTTPIGDASARAIFMSLGSEAAKAGATAAAQCLLQGGEFLAAASLLALTTGQQGPLQCDPAGTLKVGSAVLGTPIYAGSGASGGAAAANTTLTITAGKMGFLDGFDIDGLGATSGAAIAVTVVGLLGGTLTFEVGIPAGATVPFSYSKRFNPPLQASGTGVNIVLNVPSFGSGNTQSSSCAYGHML